MARGKGRAKQVSKTKSTKVVMRSTDKIQHDSDEEMEENSNSNHSNESILKKRKNELKLDESSSEREPTIKKKKYKNIVDETSKRNAGQMNRIRHRSELDIEAMGSNDESTEKEEGEIYQEEDTERAQFIEDGNRIEMEMRNTEQATDSGAETESESEQENNLPSQHSSDGEIDYTAPTTSQSDNSVSNLEDDEEDYNKKHRRKTKKRDRDAKRRSMEDKIDSLSNSLKTLQSLIKEKGILDDKEKDGLKSKERNKSKRGMVTNNTKGQDVENDVHSETMVYQNAVEFEQGTEVVIDEEISFKRKNRESSSLEDQVNTSDEIIEEIDLS